MITLLQSIAGTAIFSSLFSLFAACDATAQPASSRTAVTRSRMIPAPGQGNEYTYTITTIVKVLKPCDPASMNDTYQDVRILNQTEDSYTLEITYYPFNDRVRAAREARYAIAAAREAKTYLRPTVTCNWDPKMRADLIAQLRADGIEPDLLTNLQLVQQVSRWAMHRSKYIASDSGMPVSWYVDYPGGKARVYPALRTQFDGEKPAATWTDKQILDREVLGKSMYYQNCHGACTSSSVYLATIFRALGIPSRILYFIPPCDGNDPAQVRMLTAAIHHKGIRNAVETGIFSCRGFANHMYNEVFVDGHWVRLNYDTVGQNIVDQNYCGLLAHIDTCRDIADTHLAETWGVRSAEWPHVSEPLTSVNPYMLIQAWDHFGRFAHIENPDAMELTKVTINGMYFAGTDSFRDLLSDSSLSMMPADQAPDFMIEIKEFLPGQNYQQLRMYYNKAGHKFVLHAPGHPDIHIMLTGLDCNSTDHQGYGARISDADRGKIVQGVDYAIEPINTSPKYRWTVGTSVTARKP